MVWSYEIRYVLPFKNCMYGVLEDMEYFCIRTWYWGDSQNFSSTDSLLTVLCILGYHYCPNCIPLWMQRIFDMIFEERNRLIGTHMCAQLRFYALVHFLLIRSVSRAMSCILNIFYCPSFQCSYDKLYSRNNFYIQFSEMMVLNRARYEWTAIHFFFFFASIT